MYYIIANRLTSHANIVLQCLGEFFCSLVSDAWVHVEGDPLQACPAPAARGVVPSGAQGVFPRQTLPAETLVLQGEGHGGVA